MKIFVYPSRQEMTIHSIASIGDDSRKRKREGWVDA